MAFTSGNDINILQDSDTSFVGAGQGDDTYIVSPVTMADGQEITLTDTAGTNTLQLIDGLTIASSLVASHALQLTLSNGAVINVLGADSFIFNVGGNAITGEAGLDKDFSAFVSQTLGTSVPTDDSLNSGVGLPVTIGEETPVEPAATSADIGTLESAGTLDASGGGFVFTDDANVLNRVEISNFTSDDVIQISNASEGDYAFEQDGSDMNIIYNNDGVINHITLTGVVDPSDLLYNEELFEAAIGFDAVTYA